MIPNNRLSSDLMLEEWLIPYPDSEFTRTEGYEFGPSVLLDTESELDAEIWKYTYVNDKIYMTKMSTGEVFPLENNIVGASEISVCFNQSAQPVTAYTLDGITYLKWFDTQTAQYVVTNLGIGLTSPRVILDIKDKKSNQSDVILFYFRSNTQLCCRYQRDRFSIEYTLKTLPPHRIIRVGFNKIHRIQFLIEEVL